MEKEITPVILLMLSGITLAMCLSTGILTFSSVFAKNKNLEFEISDCIVQGNSTHEKSGPCPDTEVEIGAEVSPSNNLESEASMDNSPEMKPADYTLPDISELINPFGPLTE